MIEIIAITASLIYIAFIFYERIINEKRIKSFKHIIHVNGTRGKSTTCRLIDAGLRNLGYKVYTKTTGTIPTTIGVNGKPERIKRLGNANIREQMRIVKKAYKEKAEILVIECMAIQPELQFICQHKILKADIVVITNVRHDHLTEMGDTLEKIAKSLANTVPYNGHLIVGSDDHRKIFERQAITNNSTYNVAKPVRNSQEIDTFSENIENAMEVARLLHLDEKTYFEGMKNYIKDPGALKYYQVGETIFINGLSINDPDSIKIVYNQVLKEYQAEDITILMNNRLDRPKRALQLVDLFQDIKCKNIMLAGGFGIYIKGLIKKKYQINSKIITNLNDLKKAKVIFAIGNIGGMGYQLLNYCENNGSIIYG